MTARFSNAALLVALALGAAAPVAHIAAQDNAPPADAQPADQAPAEQTPAAGDDELFADPGAGEADESEGDHPSLVEAQDLIIGETMEVEPGRTDFRFHADAAGMLTLLTYLPDNQAQVQLRLTDAQGANVPGGFVNGNAPNPNLGARIVVDEFGNPAGAMPGLSYLTVPLPEAGDYRIEMNIVGQTETPVQIGGAWVAFEQVGEVVPVQPAVPVIPAPPPPPPVDPTEIADDLAIGQAVQLEVEDNVGWVRLVAEEPGTLVVVSRAGRNEVMLSAFPDGQFADPRYTMNRNRGGQRGNEALMFHVEAGDVWFVRVSADRDDTPVPLRAALIPDDLEPVQDE
ncbi:MAG: hypothetical protein ACIAXF_10440 [Phycisphaerales bacterium JB063]